MPARVPVQASLFDRGAPDLDPERLRELRRTFLDETAWVEYLPGFVTGQDALMEALVGSTTWRSERRPMYERMVDVPRLVASLPDDGPGHPLLDRVRVLLSARYHTNFSRVGFGYYRGGADSVAGTGTASRARCRRRWWRRYHWAGRDGFCCGRERAGRRSGFRSAKVISS